MQPHRGIGRPGQSKYAQSKRRYARTNWRLEKPKTNRKFRWHDGQGRQLTAGGLLPYDGNGVWLVGEQDRENSIEWTDLGGRYEFEDGDIFKTIAREVGEELYHSSELLHRDIVFFSQRYAPVYVNGHQKVPVYICYPVPIIELMRRGFVLDPELFLRNRSMVLKSNPMVPENYYPAVQLKYFPYSILRQVLNGERKTPTLKFRLRSVLKKFLPRIEKTEKFHQRLKETQATPENVESCKSKSVVRSSEESGIRDNSWRSGPPNMLEAQEIDCSRNPRPGFSAKGISPERR